ncbi:MAG: isochorismatase family protein [Plesiomonas sp.]
MCNIDNAIVNLQAVVHAAKVRQVLVIFLPHLSPVGAGFFEEDTQGAALVASVLERANHSHIVQKRFADAFDETALDKRLEAHQVNYITQADNMMIKIFVLFTAISEYAKKYRIDIIAQCFTSVRPVIHAIAIRGLSRIDSINVI